jgi:hypothetical protein
MSSASTVAAVISALAIPADARVDQRVPKKLFLEQGAPTPADKKHLQNGIEEVTWIAALKPANIGVPEFRDDSREYLEIAVLSAGLRPQARTGRLIELMHRAVPYPLVLITADSANVTFSLAHKRASQGEEGRVVLDNNVVRAALPSASSDMESDFLANLSVASQPSQNLFALYQGWIDCVLALAAARITGRFALARSPDAAAGRQAALNDHASIQHEIASLRAQAAKEKQINRRVELNLAIQRLEAKLVTAKETL